MNRSNMPTQNINLPASTAGVTLTGSVTTPDGTSKGLVLLLSGSGPQDRDETIAGTRPFRRLREVLASRGYTTFSWDDRGVDDSTGDYQAITSMELVTDVHQVISLLAGEHPTLFVVGHSQGTHIASRVAVEEPRVTGLLLLAGAGRRGRSALLDQHRIICESEQWPTEFVESTMRMKEACFDLLSGVPERLEPQGQHALRRELRDAVTSTFPSSDEEIEAIVEDLMEWEWRFLLQHRPDEWLKRVGCPVFAAAGDRDTQINAAADLEAIRSALEQGKRSEVEVHLLPNLNHLFQSTTSGRPSDYSELGDPFHQTVVGPICDWLDKWSQWPAT